MTIKESTLATPPYVQDIHLQPEALDRLLSAGVAPDVCRLLDRAGDFDRIVMTGMGASLFGQYPAFLRMARAGLPVWSIETAELLGAARGLITARTLLWITSQSGRTAEVLALLDSLDTRPGAVLGLTNDPSSPLAVGSDQVLELHSGDERTVGTRSYVNTLAAASIATSRILGEHDDPEWELAPLALSTWLEQWPAHLEQINALLPPSTMMILGRGASLAATMTGALIIKEASGSPVEGMSVPQFRHGPLEMAGPDLSVILLAGQLADHRINQDMRDDLVHHGTRVVWIDANRDPNGIAMPDLRGEFTRPIAEILPLQALSVVLADRRDRVPGAFTKIGKVTIRL
jgi:glucosamine--fructose-6-phosphate aminotransferase (isomerizing)